MFRPTELRNFLDSLGIQPKKSLSQNFLIDGNIVQKIVSSSKIRSEDLVLEIGPGPGVLTEALLSTGAHVIAIEKDTNLAKALERFQNQRLQIFNQDILEFPIQQTFSKTKKAKVVANLPYHLTTPILTKLIPEYERFSSITVMVQLEVAERFTAKPGTKEFGSITLFLNFYSDPKLLFKVSRNCFYPRPKVNSAVVRFDLRPPPKGVDSDLFFQLTRSVFAHRRKMLRNTLSQTYPSLDVINVLETTNIPLNARPEELSLEQFLILYNQLWELPEP